MTHQILALFSTGRDMIESTDPVADLVRGEYRCPLQVFDCNGRDVTREVFREAVAIMQGQGYTRAELPDYLTEMC